MKNRVFAPVLPPAAPPVDQPLALLGGLTPAVFMQRHWQKKPLLVRQAWPGVVPPLTRAQALAMVGSADVESRLVTRQVSDNAAKRGAKPQWQVRTGPLPRRALPPVAQPGWTVLLQGLDLHVSAAHQMLQRFRFLPDARLDDLMLSWASPGGGVGAHVDAYDVFLLQVQGHRRWRIGKVKNAAWIDGAPLKLLRHFEPTHDWLLAPGDMLYLPPGWGHDGVAEGGECMTCSVGYRAPAQTELARDLLQRLADEAGDDEADEADEAHHSAATVRYRDPTQSATTTPAAVPAGLLHFAQQAIAQRLADPLVLARVVGEWATEPKPQVWFEAGTALPSQKAALRLHARTRMLYDEHHVFINGEALAASGRDATLMHRLANQRQLAAADVARLSVQARELVSQWALAGWLHAVPHLTT
jgi:50S ribosomal protein L16 3-hydroxylase